MTGDPKGAFLGELKRTKKFFYGTVIAQAQRIEVDGAKIVFTYTEAQRTLADQIGTSRPWLEALAAKITGRKMVVAVNKVPGATPAATPPPAESPPQVDPRQATPASPSEPPPPTEPPGDLDLLQEEPYDPPVAPVLSTPEPAKSVLASPVLDSPVLGDAATRKPARALDRPVVDGPADDLFSQAMGDKAVQNMLEVLPAEIKDVEEI
jgi:hypothetical protein